MGSPLSAKKAIGIVSKPNKPEVAKIMPGLIAWLRQHERDFVVDPETAPYASGARKLTRREMGELDLELVIVLGGDGTILQVLHVAVERHRGDPELSGDAP